MKKENKIGKIYLMEYENREIQGQMRRGKVTWREWLPMGGMVMVTERKYLQSKKKDEKVSLLVLHSWVDCK